MTQFSFFHKYSVFQTVQTSKTIQHGIRADWQTDQDASRNRKNDSKDGRQSGFGDP